MYVRGGKYFLDETLVFTAVDSGTQESPIAYAAYPGEKPIFTGGRKITGWQPYQGKILQASVPEGKQGTWKFPATFLQREAPNPRTTAADFDPQNPVYGGWAFVEGPASRTAPSPSNTRRAVSGVTGSSPS